MKNQLLSPIHTNLQQAQPVDVDKLMNNKLYLILFFFITLSCQSQDQWKNIYTENAWAERDKWQRASDIIDLLRLSNGSTVADVGCHEGYMTMKLSKKVGSAGRVFAVDIQQNRLDKLTAHLEDRNIKNVTAVKGDYDDPHLQPNSLNAAIIIDTYHEMDDHDKMLMHIKTALRSGGRLVICEPIADDRRKFSRSEQERKHELGMNYALEDLKKAGFTIVFKQDPYIDRQQVKGDKMWIIVASR